MVRLGRLGIAMLLGAGALVARPAVGADAPVPLKVTFNRDVRPILSENCFACHGPDKNKRKADLRLDMAEGGAFVDHDGKMPLVAKDISKSDLYRRIIEKDRKELMPPPKSGKKLTPRQIEVLKRWIEQGAEWEPLWSFIPPRRPELPEVKDAGWCRNPIDRFILARLESSGIKPSPEADRTTLCRRLYLDLLGLPPTPAQVDAFLADKSANAYEKLVDQLLSNRHYGERMALDWLDAARFADTHGYHIDSGRDMTRWREWVINAYNSNKPFDQFTVEQLAGDLLPNASDDQKVASGFNRNNMVNFEGGAVPEEYLTAYIIDRVNTTGTVWLGLTVGCCQCHDHKFDPLTQKDFYSFYAFFNRVPENGLDGNKGNASPVLKTPSAEQKAKLEEIAASIKQVEEQIAAPSPEADAAQAEWEKTVRDDKRPQWTVLDPSEMKSSGGATLAKQEDKSLLVTGANPATDTYTVIARTDVKDIRAIRLEALPEEHLAGHGPGRSSNGNIVMTEVRLAAGPSTDPSAGVAAKFKAASADFSQQGFPIANAIDGDPKTGWAIYPQAGKPHAAVFELEQPIHNEGGVVLTVTLEFQSQFGQHQLGKFRLAATDSASPHAADSIPAHVRDLLAIAPQQRSDAQKTELRTYFRTVVNSVSKDLKQKLASLQKDREKIEGSERTTMVMAEMPTPRDTFILIRGQYDKHGEKVTPAVPKSLPPLPEGAPANRLGLAQWLTSPSHPLTARVAVNRHWQQFFGTGLVKTSEDFGSQGEEPTHPELLDWLAVEFMNPADAKAQKWDTKAMIRLMVTSATYRQSSVATEELRSRDPEDRLLARAPRLRLPAEFVRDQALAVSGLLNEEIGGKSVSPYQPAGLWEELMSRSDGANWTAQTYVQDHGKDLYRRTMYTFWKRTSPPPALATFDAPDRETCTVRRSRTNTPLQALVLENDPTYVEAARKLAERVMTEGGADLEARLNFAFRVATSRAPRPEEISVLRKIHDVQLEAFRADGPAVEKLLKVGEAPRDPKLDTAELAAWTSVCSVVLNLDETITRG